MLKWTRLPLIAAALAAWVLLGAVAFAEDSGGDAWAWGYNGSGQLGDGTTEIRNAPRKVPDMAGVTSVAGGLLHSVAVTSDGSVKAWGNNVTGQLGNGTNESSPSPVDVAGIDHVMAVSAGFNHSVALKMDGTVWSWGGNSYGQLGNGTKDDSALPVQVAGLERITQVASAGFHNLARRSDGTVWFWGTPGLGGAGFDGAQISSALLPVQLTSPLGVTDVAAGIDHDLMLKDGNVYSWGTNQYGQLGDGTPTSRLSGFTQVKGLKDAVAITAGSYHTLALAKDGKLYSWGWNGSGQLGNGTTTNSSIPVEVKGLRAVSDIAAGWYHNLARATDGTLWAWGDNLFGKLGDGTFRLSLVPKKIDGVGGAIGISAGADHSLVVMAEPTPAPTGANGSAVSRRTPAQTAASRAPRPTR